MYLFGHEDRIMYQREHLIAASRYAPFPAEQFAGGGVCCPWGGAHSTAATVFTGQAACQLAPALLAPAPTVPMIVVILDLLNCYNRVGELELGGRLRRLWPPIDLV